MIDSQMFERCPLLAAVTDELPFVFTNRKIRWQFRALAKLRSALHADKIFHGARRLLLNAVQIFQLESADDFADDAFDC